MTGRRTAPGTRDADEARNIADVAEQVAHGAINASAVDGETVHLDADDWRGTTRAALCDALRADCDDSADPAAPAPSEYWGEYDGADVDDPLPWRVHVAAEVRS